MDRRDQRLTRLATALAPHQARFEEMDALYRHRNLLRQQQDQVDDRIRQLSVDIYDGMTVQLIQAEINR